MKSRKSIFILAPLVLLIWGIIGYKIYSSLDKKDETVVKRIKVEEHQTSFLADTCKLLLSYADPFLDRMEPIRKVPSGIKNPLPAKTAVANKAAWPLIGYSGMIKNKQSNKILALLSINGTSMSSKEGEEINGVKVLKIFKDSVKLSFQKEIRHFSK